MRREREREREKINITRLPLTKNEKKTFPSTTVCFVFRTCFKEKMMTSNLFLRFFEKMNFSVLQFKGFSFLCKGNVFKNSPFDDASFPKNELKTHHINVGRRWRTTNTHRYAITQRQKSTTPMITLLKWYPPHMRRWFSATHVDDA